MMLQGKELILATKPFCTEKRFLSWFHSLSTLLLLMGLLFCAALAPSLIIRVASSFLSSFVFVRMFVIYHDYQHKSILQRSAIAKVLMYTYGLITLTPASIWTRSHDYHHKHNSKLFSAGIGSFPIMTKQKYLNSSIGERRKYLFTRNPMTIMFGFFTVFIYGMCINSFTSNPKKHFDSLIAVIIHVAAAISFVANFGFLTWFLVGFLPLFSASTIGAYLFYAQHNFPGATFKDDTEWAYETAALESSSYMKMNRFLQWSTANIGFHHVHHLNSRIPFYRLPEAMSALPELQNPKTTSLKIKDIAACCKLKLWDPEQQRMIGHKELMQGKSK